MGYHAHYLRSRKRATVERPFDEGIQSGDRRNTVTSTNTTTNTNRCARVPTPTRTPNELTSTNTTTQKIFRSNKKNIRARKKFFAPAKKFSPPEKKKYIFSVHLATKSLSARLVAPTMTVYRTTSDEVAHLATCRDTPKGSRNTPQNTPQNTPLQ